MKGLADLISRRKKFCSSSKTVLSSTQIGTSNDLEGEERLRTESLKHVAKRRLKEPKEATEIIESDTISKPLSPSEMRRALRKSGEPWKVFGESESELTTRWNSLKRDNLVCRSVGYNKILAESGAPLFFDTSLREHRVEPLDGHLRSMGDEILEQLRKSIDVNVSSSELVELKSRTLENAEDMKSLRTLNVRSWLVSICDLWFQKLNMRSADYRCTSEGRQASHVALQTLSILGRMHRRLLSGTLSPDLLTKLDGVVSAMNYRSYRRAHDLFIDLAIGNSTWPMGVTAVGIHERAGRSRINTECIAHSLNDEMTRKFVQCFKRLMTFTQSQFESFPSQRVNISNPNVITEMRT